MKFTIDRFEGDYAIVELENLTYKDLPREIIPKEAKEGDLLQVQILSRDTEDRKEEIDKKFKKLFKK